MILEYKTGYKAKNTNAIHKRKEKSFYVQQTLKFQVLVVIVLLSGMLQNSYLHPIDIYSFSAVVTMIAVFSPSLLKKVLE